MIMENDILFVFWLNNKFRHNNQIAKNWIEMSHLPNVDPGNIKNMLCMHVPVPPNLFYDTRVLVLY